MWWYQKNEDLYGLGNSGAQGGSMLSSIGGTIRLGELVPGGTIRHTMKLNLDSLNYYSGYGGYRWPATTADGGYQSFYKGTVPAMRMGSLVALKSSFNLTSLETASARILAWAFTDYGAYVTETAGWSVYGIMIEESPTGHVRDEFQSNWGYAIDPVNEPNPANKNPAWTRDMDRIFTALNVVDNWNAPMWNTVSQSNGTQGAGLGAPRVPWALPLGQGTSTLLITSPNPSYKGWVVTVSGRLQTSVNGTGIGGQSVYLEYSWDNVSWSREAQIGQFTTAADGTFSGQMQFRGNGNHYEYLRARFNGTSTLVPSLSRVVAQWVTPNPILSADFLWTINGLTASLVTTAGNATAPYSFAWTFGDGTSGSGTSINHTYPRSGTSINHTYPRSGSYSVTLTTTDARGQTVVVTKTLTC
jgi:hypothetical protein